MAIRKKRISRRKADAIHGGVSIIGIILCVVFGFFLVCNLTIIIKGTLFPGKPPAVFGTTPMVVLSGSMSGTQEGHIEVGDLIFVKKADPETLDVGDIIAFMDGSIVVTHRIVEVQAAEDGSPMWLTKGDANNAADTQPVTVDRLVGEYALRLPRVGDFALFLQKPLGMFLFIGIPVLAFIAYDIIRRQVYANREKTKAAEMQAEIERLRKAQSEADKTE